MHILNGDGTHHPFSKAGITGDVIIWREGLALGPVSADLNQQIFWDTRMDFWKSYDSVTKDLPEYNQIMMPQWHKVLSLDTEAEVTLWFEHDLFCQINLLAILAWVNDSERDFNLHLISIDRHPAHESFKGMGQLSPHQLAELFRNRVKINKSDLQFASGIWQNYCSSDPMELQSKVLESHFPRSLQFLKDALLLHLHRFPSTFNGANEIENVALDILKTGAIDDRDFVRKMLIWDEKYGFGDLEYFSVLHKLKVFINYEETIKLNADGMQLLNGKLDISNFLKTPVYLGGASFQLTNTPWRWARHTNQLVIS